MLDALVLDVPLPDGTGIDDCRSLTAATPAVVVLQVLADAYHGRVGERLRRGRVRPGWCRLTSSARCAPAQRRESSVERSVDRNPQGLARGALDAQPRLQLLPRH